ncbi:MAG: leucine-rich repeat protein [Clostridia bacterium]|nr:leucine-rich repeat protein [Clostridia bacterium]
MRRIISLALCLALIVSCTLFGMVLSVSAATNLIIGNVFAGNPVEEYVVEDGNTAYMADEYGVLYCFGEGGKITELTAYPAVSDLTKYEVPEGVKTIGDVTYNFDVTDLDLYAVHFAENLKKIVLPETLRIIKEHGLSYNGNLRELTIPASLEELGEYALSNNWNLPSVLFEGNKPYMQNEEDGTQFEESGNQCDEEFTIYYYEGAEDWADYNLYPTVALGEDGAIASGAIEGTNITWTLTMDGKLFVNGSGEIPDSVGEYDYSWHNYKDSVRGIHIGEGIKVIGEFAFAGFGKASNLTLPDSLEEILYGAFHDTNITYVTIPAAAWEIKDNVFAGSPVKEFTVAEGNNWHEVDEYGALYRLREDGSYMDLIAYPAASNRTELVVQDGVYRIGNEAICGTSLNSIILPGSLGCIGFAGISENYNLTTITIPASMSYLEKRALFANNLSSVIFEGDMPEMEYDEEEEGSQFIDNADNFTIYYYAGTMGWEDYDLYPTVAMRETSIGDVNGDGFATGKDLLILTQYVAGYAHVIDESAADIDGDNTLTRKDIMILKRYLHGWDGYDQYFTENKEEE